MRGSCREPEPASEKVITPASCSTRSSHTVEMQRRWNQQMLLHFADVASMLTLRRYLVVTPTLSRPPLIGLAARWFKTE